MPIIVAAVTAPPITPPTAPPPAPVAGQTRLTWWAPNGTPEGIEVPLSRPELGWKLVRGVRGLGAPDVTIAAEPLAAGGAEVLNQYAPPRLVTLPVRVGGADPGQCVERIDYLVDMFGRTAELGPGRLVVARPDGRRREILGYLQSGLDGDRGTGAVAELLVITLYCPEPWWRDVDTTRIERRPPVARRYLGPGYPALSSGQALGDTTVHNRGTVPAYPVWTVTGPATVLTATSARLGGAGFTFTPPVPLADGERATIVTDPLTAAVTGPDGEDWWGALDWPGADLFPLLPGANPVTFSVAGGGWVELAYQARHRSA